MIAPRGGRQARDPGVVEALEDLEVAQLGQTPPERLVERQPALLDELEGRDRRHRLGHGGDPEDRVQRHGCVLTEPALAKRALVAHAPAVPSQRDDAGHLAGLNRTSEHPVHVQRNCHLLLR